jgi:hypothetical protein
MANFKGKDADGTEAYLKASGAGTVGDPHIPEHLDTNSAAALTAVQAVQTAVEGTLTVDGSGATQPVSGTVTANLSATDNAVLDSIVTNTTDAATQTTLAGLLTELQGKADTAEAQVVDATGQGDVPITLAG